MPHPQGENWQRITYSSSTFLIVHADVSNLLLNPALCFTANQVRVFCLTRHSCQNDLAFSLIQVLQIFPLCTICQYCGVSWPQHNLGLVMLPHIVLLPFIAVRSF